MLIRMTPIELKTMILQRATEIEADWKRHIASQRELADAPHLRIIPTEGFTPEEVRAEADAHEKYNRAHREATLANASDSISRQVQWMRKMAEVFHAQTSPVELTTEDLIKLNLWPYPAIVGGRSLHNVL